MRINAVVVYARCSRRLIQLGVALLYGAALLIPAQTVSANSPANPQANAAQAAVCGGDGAGTAAVAPLAVAADQQVHVPDRTLDAAVYAANARQTLKSAGLVKAVIVGEFLSQMRRKDIASDVVAGALNQYTDAVDAALAQKGMKFKDAEAGEAYDRLVHTMLDVALNQEDLKYHVPGVWNAIMAQRGSMTAELGNAARQVIDSALRYPMQTRILKLLPQTLGRVRDCAASDPIIAQTFDEKAGKPLGVSITDKAKTIVRKRPALVVPPQIAQLIESNNTINLSLNDLKAMTKAEFERLHGAIGDMQDTLVQIDARQNVIIDYINDQQLQQAMKELAEAKAAEYQLSLDAFRSSISILYNLTGFIDPQLAEEMAVVGEAALQISDSLHGWLGAMAGMDTLTEAGALSTVIMTGNVLGAVMNVVSLFGDSAPSPDQMILEEIGKLRQEVSQLRMEMHDRFDRIDAELNTIYTTMQDRFDLIDIQLGKINGKLDAIQESLLALDLRLSRLERNTFELIDAVGRRPLLTAINGGLGYQERTGLSMPYQPEFVEFENALHTWGTIHVFDALAIGPSQRDYSAGALARELNAYPMDANLNYLNGWLKANGMPPIADNVIASPRDWLLAARAYTQLGSEWPAHMRRIDANRRAQLDAVGADIETALFNIAALPTAAGSQGNEVLFSNVISYYQGTLDQLDGAIRPLEGAYVLEVQTQELKRAEPFNLYGGIDQPLAFQAPGAGEMSYGDGAGTLPPPANLKPQIGGFNRYNLAEYFAISPTMPIATAMVGALINGRPAPGCKPDPDVCPLVGDLSVLVRVSYGNAPLLQMELRAGRVTLPLVGGDVEDPTAYAARNWANLKTRFEQEAVVIDLPADQAARRAELYAALGGLLEARLASYQQRLYNRVLTELNTGSLEQAAVRVAGGKALVDNVVTLGLPHAVSSDEFLHAMLYGSQRLMDDSQILQTYAVSATQPITGASLLLNPRLALDQTAERRSAVLGGIVDKYLDAITANTHVESLESVASTRREMELTARILELGEEPGAAANWLYLPAIRR